MLYVRVKEMELDGKPIFRNLNLDINDNCVLGISGNKKEVFLQTILNRIKFEGDIVLNEISMKGDEDEYLGLIHVMDKDTNRTSTLSVEDYLDFLAIAGRYSGIEYEKIKEVMLNKLGLLNTRKKKIKELLRKDRIKVNFVSAFIKSSSLIIFKDFLCDYSVEAQKEIIEFMKYYTAREKRILMVIDKQEICKLCQFSINLD